LIDNKGRKKVYGLTYELVDFHSSRPGHDLRYSLDGSKMKELGWQPPIDLEKSIENTVRWYLCNPKWLGR
jgi:dTDP-glucose 4,6-dehydratase